MENGSPPETIKNIIEKGTSWVDQANEEDFKNIIVQLSKNDPSEFAENVGWIQVGKKGKKSPRKTRSQTRSK